MRYIIPALVLFVFSSLYCSNNPILPGPYGNGDDYEIYRSVLIDNGFDSSDVALVLRDSTVTSLSGHGTDSIYIANLKQQLPGLLDGTFGDFISSNESPAQLKYVRGISRLVLQRDFRDTMHSGSADLVLSRIGYDPARSQAVVEMGVMWAPLVGSGALYFLIREDGRWKVKRSVMTWIS